MSADRATWVAFLRGMNLGTRRLANDQLVDALHRSGFPGAVAYQASGNVVFADGRPQHILEAALEAGLERELGYAVAVFVRSAQEVRDLAASTPFGDEQLAAGAGKRQVILLRSVPSGPTIEEIMTLVPEGDVLIPAGRDLHWLPAGGMSDSDMDMRRLDRITGGTTIRTHGTLQRLSARFLEG